MKQRLFAGMIAAGMTLGAAFGVQAQGVGLQVGDTADARAAGQFQVTPGAVFGDDVSFYGLRESYSVFDELRVFLDLGAINAKDSDVDFGAQVGALACLPSEDLICDLGLRTAIYYINTDIWDLLGASLMLVTSDETILDNLFVYGGVGGDFSIKTMDSSEDDETEVNPAFSLGALYRFTDRLSLYLEVTHVDDVFFGGGLRFQ